MNIAKKKADTFFECPDVDLDSYDHIVVCHSMGKDSWAALLHLFDMGVDRTKVEIWHHEVDGREGSDLMDWSFITDYAKKACEIMGLPLYFSWLVEGFEGEMLKEDSISKPIKTETPDGTITLERDLKRSKPATRLLFPQQAADLRTRWCSSSLKIDVGRRALNNQERFKGKRTLFITGERREESTNRAKYNQLEPHSCDTRHGRTARHVDAWRPVLHWSEERVWDALKRHGVIAPVPYRINWNRSSCMTCIYNHARVWATILKYFPERLDAILNYELRFGTTISRSKKTVLELAKSAEPFEITDTEALAQAKQKEYTLRIFCDPAEWVLPEGAFRSEGCGSI